MLSSVILLGTYLYSTCPSRLSLPLNIYLPSQVLRTNGRFYQTAPASLFCRKIPQQQGYFAPRALPRFLATFNPSYSLLPSTAFPRRVIRPTFFQVFLPGARRVSPVAQCVLVFMPWLSTPPECSSALAIWPLFHVAFIPRRRIRPLGLLFLGPHMPSLSLRPDDSLTIPKMALWMGFRQSVSLLPAILTNGFWLLPMQVYLLLNTPAFSGRAAVDRFSTLYPNLQ